MSYADLVRLKEMIGVEDADADDQLQRALDTASQVIDQYCGRSFELSATAGKKYFYPDLEQIVRVVDLQIVTTIKLDTHGDRTFPTTLSASDYELRPLDGPPYSEVRMWPMSNYAFTPGYQVEIDATWGYAEGVPQAVEQACLILANRYYKRGEAPFGILQNTDLGQYTRISEQDPDVKALLAPFVLGTEQNWVMV